MSYSSVQFLDTAKKAFQGGYDWMGLPNLEEATSGFGVFLSGDSRFHRFARTILPDYITNSNFLPERGLAFAQNCTMAILLSPFEVVEILQELQYKPYGDTIHGISSYEQSDSNYLPILQNGVWENIHDIVESPNGGMIMLFRGSIILSLNSLLCSRIQPLIENLLNDYLNVYKQVNPTTLFASHLVASALLYPLDVVRVCLILRSPKVKSKDNQKIISTIYSKLRKGSSELLEVYNYKNIIFPAVVTASSYILTYISGFVISEVLGINPDISRASYYIARVFSIAIESAILCPFRLVKHRLIVQNFLNSANNKTDENSYLQQSHTEKRLFTFRTSVELYPQTYNNFLDCISTVISSEGKSRKLQNSPQPYLNYPSKKYSSAIEDNNSKNRGKLDHLITGISSLSRGFWCCYASRLLLFVFSEMNKVSEEFPWSY